MKTSIQLIFLLLLSGNLLAKKVKFAVDMTGQTISPNGVHLVSDFQALCNLGADWDPAASSLSQEGSSNIYSIIVNLPAFKKYEYRFVNGDQSYEAEFVPNESRVGYDFVDNRWLYVDSLKNDTTFVGAILFGGNAPAGKSLLRFKVDMRVAGIISPNGVHVGVDYTSSPFDPKQIRMYSFVDGIYEIINYVNNGTHSYVYFNGNQNSSSETVPSACATGTTRTINVTGDLELSQVCFNSCAACVGVGISEQSKNPALVFFPNPASETLTIQLTNQQQNEIRIKDLNGKLLRTYYLSNSNQTISLSGLNTGIYILESRSQQGNISKNKLVVN